MSETVHVPRRSVAAAPVARTGRDESGWAAIPIRRVGAGHAKKPQRRALRPCVTRGKASGSAICRGLRWRMTGSTNYGRPNAPKTVRDSMPPERRD
jgi:hypothetical protein